MFSNTAITLLATAALLLPSTLAVPFERPIVKGGFRHHHVSGAPFPTAAPTGFEFHHHHHLSGLPTGLGRPLPTGLTGGLKERAEEREHHHHHHFSGFPTGAFPVPTGDFANAEKAHDHHHHHHFSGFPTGALPTDAVPTGFFKFPSSPKGSTSEHKVGVEEKTFPIMARSEGVTEVEAWIENLKAEIAEPDERHHHHHHHDEHPSGALPTATAGAVPFPSASGLPVPTGFAEGKLYEHHRHHTFSGFPLPTGLPRPSGFA